MKNQFVFPVIFPLNTIGSMYGIFTYICPNNPPNVGKYTSTMDPMGTNPLISFGYHVQDQQLQPFIRFGSPWPREVRSLGCCRGALVTTRWRQGRVQVAFKGRTMGKYIVQYTVLAGI